MKLDTDEMLKVLRDMVETESPSSDLIATKHCAHVVADHATRILRAAPVIESFEGRTALHWSMSKTKVLVLGHFDTVWPIGTTSRWPFSVDGDKATGPGTFDMKAGIVQGLFALASLDDLSGVELLLTSDEEVGSEHSAYLIEEAAKRADATIVLEPSADGALKIARKGVASFLVSTRGRASHAGLDPEKGINAFVELALQVPNIVAIARPDIGTTVTPTLSEAGTARNTVPAQAQVWVDVRARTNDELLRVTKELEGLNVAGEGSISVTREHMRAPLETSSSSELFAVALQEASSLGIDALEGVEVGGGSDGNITAGVGCPTLDGLGAVGGNAHAEGEFILVSKMSERAALVAALVDRLRQ